MAENLKIPASVDLEIRQAEAKAKVLADKVSASFGKIKIGGFDSSGLKAGSAALGRIRQDADQFTKSMEAANARVLAFGTAVGIIEGMRRSFLALVKTTVDVEKALTQISVIAGDNFTKAGISIEQFGKQIFQTAKLTGQSFETTSKAALEFSRQGLSVQETLKRTRDALILSRISGVDYKTAVDGLTSTLNAFKQSGLDSTTVINKLVAVDNAAAVSLVDLIEGLQRSASVSQLTGQNIDQTIASIATLQEITARGGSQIGNSLKSIFTRLYDEDSIKFLETFQGGVIKVRDEVGNLIPAIDIMRNLGNAIKDLPKEQQLNIFKDISGLYQVNAAAALAGQGLQELNKQKAIYDKNLATSQGAKNNALSANASLAEILSSKFNTLSVQLEEILNSAGKIGVANPLSKILDSVSETGDFIQNILEGTDKFSQTIQGIGRFLGGSLFSPAVFAAIAIAIGKIGVNFAAFAIEAGKTFLGLNKASLEQAAIQKSIAAYIQQSGANLNTLLTSESARLNLSRQISAEWAKQAVYSKQVGGVAQVVAGSVFGAGLRAGETGPTLRGKRSAEGYLPDLVSGEMNDIKKGVGGASSNSKVVVMPNFPLGGGNKGLMVANSSESVVNLGGGKFGVLNPDMMGKRAASGFSAPKATIQNKKGQFIGGTELRSAESAIQSLIELLVGTGASAANISSTLGNFIGAMDLQAKSIKLLIDLGKKHAQSMKDEAIAAQNAAAAQMKMAQAQDAFVKSGGPNLAMMNKGGTGFNSSPELSGLGFRRGKFEPFQKDPFNISSVYTPEKLEQIRKNKVFDQRKQIDGDKRRAEQNHQKRLQGGVSYQRARLSMLDREIGETKFKLKTEKDPILKQDLIQRLKSSQGSRNYGERNLASLEKILFEKYGTDTSKFSGKPLSQNQRVNNDALKESLRARLNGRSSSGSGGTSGSRSAGGGFAGFSQNGPLSPDGGLAPVTEKAKKSLVEVAGKLILLQAATDGITAAIGGTESQFGKLSLALGQASTGLVAISELGEIDSGGFADSLKSSLEKAGEKIKNIGTSGTSDFARGARAGVAGEGSAADFAEFGTSFVDEVDEFGNKIYDVKTKSPKKRKVQGALSNSRSARAGRAFGGITSGAAGLVSGLAGVGGSLLKFLPILGQEVVIFSTLNQVVEALTGKSGFQMLKEAFGGLTAEAEKSAQAFRDNAKVLFDNSGKAILRNPEEVSQGFRSRLEVAQRERQAKLKGIDTSGKNQDDIANELLGARLDELLSQTKTGGKKEGIVGGTAMIGGVGGAYRPIYGLIDETLGNIDESITTEIKESLQLLSNQTEVGLRELLTSKGISKISGEDIKNLGLDKLQEEVLKLFLDNIAKNISTIKLAKDAGQSRDVISQLGLAFSILPKATVSGKANSIVKAGQSLTPTKVGQERIENLIDVKSLQEEILSYEELSLKTQLRTGELTEVQNANLEARLRTVENERQERQKIVDLIGNSVSTFGKSDLAKGVDSSRLEDLEAKIQSFNGEAEQARSIVAEIGELFAPSKAQELVDIFESGNKKLEAQKKIRLDILNQTNSQAIKESEILQKLERQRSLFQARFDLGESGRSLARGKSESIISNLETRAGGANVGILESENLKREALRERRKIIQSSLISVKDEAEKTQLELQAKQAKTGDESIALQIQSLNNSTQERIDALNSESAALEENIKTLGEVPGFLKEFNDQFVNFERGLPQAAAQNQFNLLQATDKSSIVSGLISDQSFDASSGKSGADLVSSLAEQNALRQQQFDIATASSKVERLNLETELELTRQILEIKNSNLSASEKQLAIESAVNQNLEKRRSFGFGVKESLSGMQDEILNFGNSFGKTATEGFKDSLVSAMQAATSSTGNLRDSLLNIALEFSNKLRDAAINNLANMLTSGLSKTGVGSSIGSFFGSMFGAQPKKFAMGGFVSAGSKSIDDVPALLKSGEFVMNQSAVSSLGRGTLEAANNGYFAPGVYGQGKLSGKDQLLSFATQTATGGKNDLVSDLYGGGGMVSLEPESGRLTNFARFGDSPILQATQDVKEQALGLYFRQMDEEKAFAEQLAQEKKARKDAIKGMLINLAFSAGSGLLKRGLDLFGGRSKEIPFKNDKLRKVSERPFFEKSASKGEKFVSSMGKGASNGSSVFKATAYGNAGIDPTTAMDQRLADAGVKGYKGFSQFIGASGRKLIPGYSVASNKLPLGTRLLVNGREFRVDDRGGMAKNIIDFYAGDDLNLYKSFARMGRFNPVILGRNSGGAISGAGDQVPVMASKGEHIINSSAAKKIGSSTLDSINKGFVPESGGIDSSAIVLKLDELIQKTQATNEIKIEISVSPSGEASGKTTAESDNSRLLGEKLHTVIVQALKQEQRPGGVLYQGR